MLENGLMAPTRTERVPVTERQKLQDSPLMRYLVSSRMVGMGGQGLGKWGVINGYRVSTFQEGKSSGGW